MTSPLHYDEAYFSWQKTDGELGAVLDQWKFAPYLSAGDVVLDFGCGGGYLLAALNCGERYGIEVNAAAHSEAQKRIVVYSSVEDLPVGVRFDKIISNHALEHVENPLEVLRRLRERLKPRGLAIFVVPAEAWYQHRSYDPGDINQHLYTWTPLLLGNLFARAGYDVEAVQTLCHSWLPKVKISSRLLPRAVFDVGCRLYAFVRGYRQLRLLARPLPNAPR